MLGLPKLSLRGAKRLARGTSASEHAKADKVAITNLETRTAFGSGSSKDIGDVEASYEKEVDEGPKHFGAGQCGRQELMSKDLAMCKVNIRRSSCAPPGRAMAAAMAASVSAGGSAETPRASSAAAVQRNYRHHRNANNRDAANQVRSPTQQRPFILSVPRAHDQPIAPSTHLPTTSLSGQD